MGKHEDYESKTKELIADILKDAGVMASKNNHVL